MNEPVENALRRSLAAHAGEREPHLDPTLIRGLARRRRARRRAVGASVVLALVLAVPAVLTVLATDTTRPDRLDVAEPAHTVLEPGELTARLLRALGSDATVLVDETDLPLGPVTPADAYAAGESTRTAGRAVTVRLAQDIVQTYIVRWESLSPAPSDDALREGLSRLSAGEAALAAAEIGSGRGYAVPVPGGVAVGALPSSGFVVGLELLTGDPDADATALAQSALAVAAAVADAS